MAANIVGLLSVFLATCHYFFMYFLMFFVYCQFKWQIKYLSKCLIWMFGKKKTQYDHRVCCYWRRVQTKINMPALSWKRPYSAFNTVFYLFDSVHSAVATGNLFLTLHVFVCGLNIKHVRAFQRHWIQP